MDTKTLVIGLILGLLIGTAVTAYAKDIIPQGNLDFKGEGAILDAESISIRSPDTTLWTCTVSDMGAFTCAEV